MYAYFGLKITTKVNIKGRGMVFNATVNNIAVISWRSVLLVEETGVSLTCCKSLTNCIT